MKKLLITLRGHDFSMQPIASIYRPSKIDIKNLSPSTVDGVSFFVILGTCQKLAGGRGGGGKGGRVTTF